MPAVVDSDITIDEIMKTPQYKRELALCKKAGGDIAAIFKLKLDLKQLEQVRKGLVSAVDIYVYMKPELPWVEMEEYRLELEQKVDLSNYRASGYDRERLAQIRLGKVSGVDVTQYHSKNYNPQQMEQIRLGLEDNIPIIFFADTAFDYLQMQEIRLGLEHEIDITSYALADIPFLKMRAIRECLEDKIEVPENIRNRYDARVIRQWHIAYKENIDISDYLKFGYDADQLEQIVIAQKKGLDGFDKYLLPELRGEALHQIRLGLENHINVMPYASTSYTWKQMRELRLGMEKQVDVSFYTNPKYHANQMKEIRLGLESNVDVKEYCSLMYTAIEMRKMRVWMEAGKRLPKDRRIVFDDLTLHIKKHEKKKFDVDWEFLRTAEGSMITVSDDLMEGFVTLSPLADIKKYTVDYVMTLLFKARIRKGINKDAIREMINEHQFGVRIKVAEGKAPTNGADGYYEFFFDKWVSADPDLLEDGTADFSNVKLFEEIKMGDKLAYYHKPLIGEDGYTITGEDLFSSRGKDLPPLKGKGFMVLTDKLTYVSAISGVVKCHSDHEVDVLKLDVLDKKDISSSGEEYPGCVIVKCDLSMGNEVRAVGDILVEGDVNLANIRSGGNVVIKGMCTGSSSDRAEISAKGIVAGTGFDSTNISAGGSIMSNSCINCKAFSADKVIMFGDNGTINGGVVQCLNGIETSVLGSRYRRETVVDIGVTSDVLNAYDENQRNIKKAQTEMKLLQEQLDKLNDTPGTGQRIMQMKIKVKTAQSHKEKELQEYIAEKRKLDEKIGKISGAVIMVSNLVYMGSVITIDGVTLRLHENIDKYGGMTFYRKDKTIEIK
ncbi:MAG: FapA family protein [Butyrivibrio sp.]|nr:FapA family protein [Butyrivibrio sp.]